MSVVICGHCGLPCEVVKSEKPLPRAQSDRMRAAFRRAGAPVEACGKPGDPPLVVVMWVSACCRSVINNYEPPDDNEETIQ